ncbi:glycosyltransferase [Helicobacter sp. 23-1048]
MTTNPKVSIALITYNQQDYVGRTIESILNQTYQNFEIIVGDDSSTDETANVVKSYKDERIKYFKTDYNIGINGNLNLVANKATTDYVFFISGDDKWRENYLERVVDCFEKMSKIDVVYPQLCAIDKDDNYIKGKNQYFWRIPTNRTKEETIHIAFMECNVLPSPGIAMRKRVIDTIFPLPCSLVNMQDYAMHLDIFTNDLKVYVLDELLVDYRVSDVGISHNNNNNIALKREQMEIAPLMDYFLKIDDLNLLKAIFVNEIQNTKIEPFSDTIPFFLGQMALLSPHFKRKEWGYHTIMKFLSDKSNFDIANKRYGFTFKDHLKLIEKISLNETKYVKKYKKYKKSFNISLIFFAVLFIIFMIHIFIFD